MGATKNPNEVSLLIRFLGIIFPVLRRSVFPVLYIASAPFLVYYLSRLHPFFIMLILSTTSAGFVLMVLLVAPISVLGTFLEMIGATRMFMPTLRYCFYTIIRVYGKIFHGYEIYGMERVDRERPGLIIYYHSMIPIDIIYLTSEIYRKTGRVLTGVAHRELARPWNLVLRFMKFSSEKETLVNDLKGGAVSAIAPGGEREALFSNDYEILWNKRIGFARLAKEMDIPIYPLFTVNSRESMPVSTFGLYDFLLEVFEKTREYLYIFLIMLPVKLRVYIGEPLHCGEDESAKEFADRVQRAIEKLRDTHQRKPYSTLAAFLERFQ